MHRIFTPVFAFTLMLAIGANANAQKIEQPVAKDGKPAASAPVKPAPQHADTVNCWFYNDTAYKWESTNVARNQCGRPETWKFAANGDVCYRTSSYNRTEAIAPTHPLYAKCPNFTPTLITMGTGTACVVKDQLGNTSNPKTGVPYPKTSCPDSVIRYQSNAGKQCVMYRDGIHMGATDLSKCGISMSYEFNWGTKECAESFKNAEGATVRGNTVELGKCGVTLAYESAGNGQQCFEKYMPRGERGNPVDKSKCTAPSPYVASPNGRECLEYKNGVYVGKAALDKCGITLTYALSDSRKECVEQYQPSGAWGNKVNARLCNISENWSYVANGNFCYRESNYGKTELIGATDARYVNCPNFTPTLITTGTGADCVVMDQFGNTSNPKTGVAYPKTSCRVEARILYKSEDGKQCSEYKDGVRVGAADLSKCGITLTYAVALGKCSEIYKPSNQQGRQVELGKCGVDAVAAASAECTRIKSEIAKVEAPLNATKNLRAASEDKLQNCQKVIALSSSGKASAQQSNEAAAAALVCCNLASCSRENATAEIARVQEGVTTLSASITTYEYMIKRYTYDAQQICP